MADVKDKTIIYFYEMISKKNEEVLHSKETDILLSDVENHSKYLSESSKLLLVSAFKMVLTDSTNPVFDSILTSRHRILATLKHLLLFERNKFVTVCARNCFVHFLKTSSLTEVTSTLLDEFHKHMNMINNHLLSRISIMELFVNCLSVGMIENNADLEEYAIQLLDSKWEKTITLYIFVKKSPHDIVSQDDEYSVAICLTLWKTILKRWKSVGDKHSSPVLVSVSKILKQIKHLPVSCFGKAVNVVRTSLKLKCSSGCEKNIGYNYLNLIKGDTLAILINCKPQEGFLGCRNLISKESFTCNKVLRRMILLCIKCCCLCFENESDKDKTQNTWYKEIIAVDCIDQMLASLIHPWCLSLLKLFEDQDDYLVDILYGFLQLYLLFSKRERFKLVSEECNSAKKIKNQQDHDIDEICSKLNPHLYFLQFLNKTGWDDSLLLDFIISPETDFLLYIMKYLKFTLSNWNDLLYHCSIFTNLQSGDTQKTQNCINKSILGKKMSRNSTVKLSCEEYSSKGDGNILAEKTSLGECLNSPNSKNSASNHIVLVDYSDSECESISSEDSVLELEESDIKYKSNSSSIISGKSEQSHEFENQTIKLKSQVDKTAVKNHFKQDNIVLDQFMAVLIRLGLKIERMIEQKIFPFKAQPLVHLVHECEILYEAK